jgi:nitrite reductase/ring-hydroxylating ferredoxin subunit
MKPAILCALSDLNDFGTKAFSAGAGDWPLRGFVVRHGEQVFAYLNRCPHAGHPLNLRPDRFLTDDGALILCNSHGAQFEPATGICVDGPCVGRRLQRLPIRIEGDFVLLDADPDELARVYA